ncbi:hypothetical protein A3F66_02495 [candidate division TM6 bacterium RIFCSPHIGHO2_12_FULL_32_22]|nr:MAG: hypothetical protein A3F66_02495 [candidate division TM6 bacterium RIFCSPHIGHO2_12_FULL_32_22]
MNIFKKVSWPARWAGMCIGFLYGVTWLTVKQLPGTSTTFVRLAAAIENLFVPNYVKNSAYFNKYFSGFVSLLNWQTFFVIGILIGASISVFLSGDFKKEYVPSLWKDNFGSSKIVRFIGAFIGGAIMLFGARIAGGCTSGKAIAEGILMTYSGWIFMCSLFASGIVTAFLFYRRKS